MAMTRFTIRNRTRQATQQTGREAVQYLKREGIWTPETTYLTRTRKDVQQRDDLRHVEVGNLPVWARGSAERFFEAAYTYERANGRYAVALQMPLPRELPHEAHLMLARDFIETHLHDKPYLWVKHEPMASDGLPQPHIHILCSTRMMPNTSDAATFFRRPEVGGARKDAFWNERQAGKRLRESWCSLANYHLERQGSAVRLYPGKTKGESLEVNTTRATQAWEDHKRVLGIADVHQVPREDMVCLVWGFARGGMPGKTQSRATVAELEGQLTIAERQWQDTQARIAQLQRAQRGELRAHELLAVVQGEARVQQGLTAHLDQHEEWGQSYGR